MSLRDLPCQLLKRFENELQRLASAALAEGDYAIARLAVELAEGVASLGREAGLASNGKPDESSPPPPGKQAAVRAEPSGKGSSRQSVQGTAEKPRKQTRMAKRVGSKTGYPRFAKDNDKLVKIGWSKRTKTEYEHKAPWAAVEGFSSHIRRHTRTGRIFKIEDLLPVPDPENDGDLPTYQVYLALAWLRDVGLAEKHGRDGYTIEHASIDAKPLAQAFKKLRLADRR